MMQCPNCQIDVVAGAVFCNHCGVQIQKLCNTCYTSNPAESRFCRSCGGSLSSEPESPTPAPPALSVTAPRGQDMPQDTITTCPRCRKVNEPGSMYCFSCGLPLEKDAPSQIKGRSSSITESPIHWYVKAMKQYGVFHGRARRREFWYFFLFQSIFFILFLVAGSVIEARLKEEIVPILLWLYLLANFIPSLAVSVRRLHDVNRSGWYSLAPLIPWLNLLVQRLHDVDRSGWLVFSWLVFMEFIAIIGVIASIVLLVWAARDSSPGENRFGPNPKDTTI